MNQDNTADVLNYDANNKPKLSSGLNVLTILTFIGCCIQLLTSVWAFFTAQKNYEGIDKLVDQMNSESMPSWAKSLMGDPAHIVETITKSYENRLPIILLSLVSVALCFYGALQMRKLKKQGFLVYTIGEILPFLTQGLFIGFFTFSGFGMLFAVAIALLFIILYAMQRKNLVY